MKALYAERHLLARAKRLGLATAAELDRLNELNERITEAERAEVHAAELRDNITTWRLLSLEEKLHSIERAMRPKESNMHKFRKKPVVIEAFQMTQARRMDSRDWPNWLHEAWNRNWPEPGAVCGVTPAGADFFANSTDQLQIATLEGIHLVNWGDWIIRGVKGELYPCKPDIFAMTYEAITLMVG